MAARLNWVEKKRLAPQAFPRGAGKAIPRGADHIYVRKPPQSSGRQRAPRRRIGRGPKNPTPRIDAVARRHHVHYNPATALPDLITETAPQVTIRVGASAGHVDGEARRRVSRGVILARNAQGRRRAPI